MVVDKNIYLDSQRQLCVSLPRPCELCSKLITDTCLVVEKYSRSPRINNMVLVVCFNCFAKAMEDKVLYEHTESRSVGIVNAVKNFYRKIFFSVPAYKNSKNDLSVFDVADIQVGSETTIDNAIVSGKVKAVSYNNKKLLEDK